MPAGGNDLPRKQSAFDVLLGKRKQPSTPPSSALAALQGAMSRPGGSLSPAATGTSTKRVRTPTGVSKSVVLTICKTTSPCDQQADTLKICSSDRGYSAPPVDGILISKMQESSYAACPICSRSVPRALLDEHTNSCLDTRASQPAAQSGGVDAASDVQPPLQAGSLSERDAKQAEEAALAAAAGAAASKAGDRAAAEATADSSAPTVQPHQARLDGTGSVTAQPSYTSGAALGAVGGSSQAPGMGSQARQADGRALQQPAATDSSQQHPQAGVSQARDADSGSAAAAGPLKGGNAFAALMQKQRQLAQVCGSAFLPFHLQDRQCWSARHGYPRNRPAPMLIIIQQCRLHCRNAGAALLPGALRRRQLEVALVAPRPEGRQRGRQQHPGRLPGRQQAQQQGRVVGLHASQLWWVIWSHHSKHGMISGWSFR